jgi:hypothetical protein
MINNMLNLKCKTCQGIQMHDAERNGAKSHVASNYLTTNIIGIFQVITVIR